MARTASSARVGPIICENITFRERRRAKVTEGRRAIRNGRTVRMHAAERRRDLRAKAIPGEAGVTARIEAKLRSTFGDPFGLRVFGAGKLTAVKIFSIEPVGAEDTSATIATGSAPSCGR